MNGFTGTRSQLYKEALQDFPNARRQDIETMHSYLRPQKNEVILEVGAGGGFFSEELADHVQKLVVSDASLEQLQGIESFNRKNISVVHQAANELSLEANAFDAIWSFGAMHHVFQKTQAFQNFYELLQPGGRLCIIDVFSGSSLAHHFDEVVAKHCVSGHEVAFLSHAYAESLCAMAGFKNTQMYDVPIQWVFDKKNDVGLFLYKLHAMLSSTPDECTASAERILGIEQKDSAYYLNWPLTVLLAEKSM